MIGPPPRVSVIITIYQRAAYLAEAIESVIDQTYQDFEVIVVEDGSHVAQEIAGRYGKRVHYVWQTRGRTSGSFIRTTSRWRAGPSGPVGTPMRPPRCRRGG
jgi:glycosyltransferase involved in cell wall biosynthesis